MVLKQVPKRRSYITKKALISQGLFANPGCAGYLTGAVEWNRTITELPPPAPQAGASTSSATTANRVHIHSVYTCISKFLKSFANSMCGIFLTQPSSFIKCKYYFCGLDGTFGAAGAGAESVFKGAGAAAGA